MGLARPSARVPSSVWGVVSPVCGRKNRIMPTSQKAQVIEQAKAWYSGSVGVVFADYRGLKVHEVQNLRALLREKGGEIHVLKNTLFRIAAGDDAAKMPEELLHGPTAVAFVHKNENECAKALVDFAKSSKKLVVKGGFFGGRSFSGADVENLAKLPPRDQLIAQVIGAVAAPLSALIGTVEAIYAQPIRTIYAAADKANEGTASAE